MVPTQELIKGRQSLLRVIFCTTPCKNVWTTTLPLLHLLQLLKMMAMMAILLEMNSKGRVLS